MNNNTWLKLYIQYSALSVIIGTASLKSGITQKYATGGINLSHSLPVIVSVLGMNIL